MTDTTTLRRLAEAATRGPLPVSEVEAYMDAAHPAAVLALLDEVERLRELAWHLRCCRTCGETDMIECGEGHTLWETSMPGEKP